MKPNIAQSLDLVLQSAIILGWTDVVRDATSGLLHLEYAFAPDGSLDCLKLWSSVSRGHWRLVCTYWMSPSALHGSGLHFEDGFRSDGLAQNLEFIMRHQPAFVPSPNFGRTGLLQIQSPTEEVIRAATNSVRDAYCRVNSFSAKPSLA